MTDPYRVVMTVRSDPSDIERVVFAASGLPIERACPDADNAAEWAETGYQSLAIVSDWGFLRSAHDDSPARVGRSDPRAPGPTGQG
ncbi:MAG TPA: hypothetical protein VNF73_02160 [Candidatus Saccharimonadales bacterium]|nr:hypothetical protein [Candidatus Saccharimonadales bacterium]